MKISNISDFIEIVPNPLLGLGGDRKLIRSLVDDRRNRHAAHFKFVRNLGHGGLLFHESMVNALPCSNKLNDEI